MTAAYPVGGGRARALGWEPTELEVERCERLLGDHLLAALQRFGGAALGVIDLPPIAANGSLVPAQIRAAATLFWAMNVEAAGIPGFVDALAQGLVEGRLLLPLTGGADKLMAYWRERTERFSAEERIALYRRLFGGPGQLGDAFLPKLDELARLIAEVRRSERGERRALTARANVVARDLAALLSDRSVGITGFAAREIIAHVRAALALLRDPDIAVTLGGVGIWQAIRAHSGSIMGRAIDPTPHVDRARAGLAILEWLADSAPALEGGEARIEGERRLIDAAEMWRSATGAP
jgi:hypothetical protein